jgi:hypothetical protein
MADLKERIEAEWANIEQVLALVPETSRLPTLSPLELAGVGSLLHNLYNGVENVLKQILMDKSITLPQGASWHRDLLLLAVELDVIDEAVMRSLSGYLAFRHFFSHSYVVVLDPQKLALLVTNCAAMIALFKSSIARYRS